MGGCLCYVWYKEYCCNVFFTTIFIAIPGATHVFWLESGLRGAAFTFLHTTFRFKAGRGVWFGHTQRCLDGDTKAESELRIMATFLFPFWHGLFQISEANLWRWRLAEVGRGGCCTECVCKPFVWLSRLAVWLRPSIPSDRRWDHPNTQGLFVSVQGEALLCDALCLLADSAPLIM